MNQKHKFCDSAGSCILLSVKPQFCNLIAQGLKTIEVRKTRPNFSSFKCFIYMTRSNDACANGGKVIGEFMCYDISIYQTEFYPESKQPVLEAIWEYDNEEDVFTAVASNEDVQKSRFLRETCLELEDFRRYLGNGENLFYGWHISDPVIYDRPRELSEFYRRSGRDPVLKPLSRPPQSWCYVEDGESNG